jgi:hypothetical protein
MKNKLAIAIILFSTGSGINYTKVGVEIFKNRPWLK